MSNASSVLRLCGGLCLVLLFQYAPHALARSAEPIAPADLTATDSAAFPGVDAEILLSENRIEGSGSGVLYTPEMTGSNGITLLGRSSPGRVLPTIEVGRTSSQRRVRVKVYTQRGVEIVGKVAIKRPRIVSSVGVRDRADSLLVGVRGSDLRGALEDVWARVVKPDGSIRELGEGDLFPERDDAGDDQAVRLAFPGLEPGDIVEYGWTTDNVGVLSGGGIVCQDRFPIRECRFVFVEAGTGYAITWLNCEDVKTTREGKELRVVLRNLPAAEAEPYMPALWDHRTGLFFVNSEDWRDSKRLWLGESARWSAAFDEATTPDRLITAKARELIGGMASDEEKLRRIHEFCQGEIVNFDQINTPEVQKERDEFLAWRQRARRQVNTDILRWVLKERMGDAETINFLFAALARGAGFSVYQTRSADNGDFGKAQNNLGWNFLRRRLVVVEVAGQPRYFSPGQYFLPYGMVDRRDEGVQALRLKNKSVQSAQTPLSSSVNNRNVRKGRFRLTADGDLEGDVEEQLSGHGAIEAKEWGWRRSDDAAAERFRKIVTDRLKSAEVTAVEFTNLRTRAMPLVVRYHVSVPGFAERVGGRLALSPAFFELGADAVFTEEVRRTPIRFPYAWSEYDDIEIVLPEGFELESPSAPSPLGDCAKLGVAYSLQYNRKTRTLVYGREFALGGNGVVRFPVEAYPALKRLFHAVAAGDRHSLLLKSVPIPAGEAAAGSE